MNLLREYILISSQNSILSDRRYITEVLCVEIPLHESYPFSHEVQSKILYEHMLLEGFWSDVKEMAGTTKQLFSTFKEVTTDPKRLASFSSIIGKTAKYPVKQMYKLLDTIIDTLAKHEDKFPTFVSWAKKLKAFIKKLIDKVYGVDGWKGALVKTSFALAIKYLWDNVGEMVEAVNDGLKSLLTKLKDDLTGDKLDEMMDAVKDFLKEKLSPVIDWVKEKFMSLAGKLVTQFSGISAWFDWAKTAFEGAKFVLGFLTNPLKKFGTKITSEETLREYIKELLSESRGGSVHPKIYEMIASADEKGYKVATRNYEVILYDKDPTVYQGAVKPIAIVQWTDDKMYGPCLSASIVSYSKAMGSYGPLLYDLAIEMTGGLVPDRTQVSNSARDVWKYYNDQRDDVQKVQLDDLQNSLTPEEKDNCEQLSAAKDDSTGNLDAGDWAWGESPLSKKYSKQGRPVYNELRSRGMIAE